MKWPSMFILCMATALAFSPRLFADAPGIASVRPLTATRPTPPINAGAKVIATKTTLSEIKTALAVFEVDTGRYPTTDEGLDVLVNKPKANADGWYGPYLQSVAKDAWANAFIYRCPSKEKGKDFDLLSCGPDGQEGGGDDVTSTPSP